jgi:hypothetical protein
MEILLLNMEGKSMSQTQNTCSIKSDRLAGVLTEEIERISMHFESFQMPKRFLDFRLKKLAEGKQVNLWDLVSPDYY